MQLFRIILTAFIAISTAFSSGASTSFKFLDYTIELTDSATARQIIGTSDSYTQSLSPFDVTIRLQDATKTKEAEYLQYAQQQVRNWNDLETEQLKKSFGEIEKFVQANHLVLHLPKVLHVIKTTAKEEFEAEGYTRGPNIILNGATSFITTGLVAHEFFHVYSRMNEKKRDDLYGLIGFKKCNPINYSDALRDQNITNPDCPVVEHYVSVKHGDTIKDMILVLYSTQPFTSGNVLMQSADIKLMEVTGDDTHKTPKMMEGKPVMHGFAHVPDLFNKISRNTPYALHPEEVCAELFSLMIRGEDVPDPEYIEQMKRTLQE